MGYATGPGLDPVPERNNQIANIAPITPDPCYSDPIDMATRVFLKLAVDFTKGSLTNCALYLQIWNGVAWVDDYGADGANRWSYTMTADTDRSLLVGDTSGTIEQPVPIAWRFCRIKIDPSGTNTGSSISIRAAAK